MSALRKARPIDGPSRRGLCAPKEFAREHLIASGFIVALFCGGPALALVPDTQRSGVPDFSANPVQE